MALTYRSSLRTTRMQDVVDDIDSGGSAGTLEIGDSGFANVLATHALPYPCGSVSGDVLTLGTIADVGISNNGTGAEARIKKSDGTVIVSGLSVGTSGADVIVNTTTYATTQNSKILGGTLTHPS